MTNMDDIELQNLCSALDTLLNPNIDNVTRSEAQKLCEFYKESPKCIMVGFHLTNCQTLPINVRYFGLQLLKHRVRMHWTSLKADEQLNIKRHILHLISASSDKEPAFIKSLTGSLLAEVVKHVWPQQWPNMQTEIITQYWGEHNMAAVEIIMLMFLGLAEDVVLYQNVASKSRARDLRQALTLAAAEIVVFFLKVLKYQATLLTGNTSKQSFHVVEVTLRAMQGYLEWINIDILFMKEGEILNSLFKLCEVEGIQVLAAECLYIIVCRRGRIEERMDLLKLTNDLYVEKYVSAIKKTSQWEGFDQSHFQFLCITGRVLSSLTTLLIGLWEDDEKNTRGCPNELLSRKNFLEVLFFFAKHDSKVIAQTVIQSWSNLLQHKAIRKDPTLLALVPLLLDMISENMCIIENKTPFTQFEEMSSSDEEQLNNILKAYRGNIVELLRYCCCAMPLETLHKCFEFIDSQLNAKCDSDEKLHKHLDNMLTFVDIVMGSVVVASEECGKKLLLPVALAEKVMVTFLAQNSKDYVAMKIFLSCASKLCKLVALSKNPRPHFKLLIERIFSILDETSDNATQYAASNLRRHACATVVRTSKTYPKILVTFTDYFQSLILDRLNQTPCKLSPFERVAMFESLILISNEWNNFAKQSQLIAEIIKTTHPVSQSVSFISAIKSPVEFANAIGVSMVPPDLVDAEDIPSNRLRSDIYYYVAMTLAVINRTKAPETQFTSDTFAENPCGPYLDVALDHALTLTSLVTSLWSPNLRHAFLPQNERALDLKESEKRNLILQNCELAVVRSASEEKMKSHWERLQNFFMLCLDITYQILGLCGKVLGPKFYRLPNLQQLITCKVLSNVEFLPSLRLKLLMRHFLGPFFQHCPVDLTNDVVAPLLQTYCQFMMERLRPAWDAFGKREFERLQGSDKDEVEEKEEQEILEEQILRTITREHFDLLVGLCVNKHPPSRSSLVSENDSLTDDVVMKSVDGAQVMQLTSSGAAIANSPAGEYVLYSGLIALSWHDTTTAHKSKQLLSPFLKQLLQSRCSLFTAEFTKFIMEAILRGLATHGQHDGSEAQLSALALMVTQTLKEPYAYVIASVLNAATQSANPKEVEIFLKQCDTMLEKKRKAAFKKIVSKVIQQHIGQKFKEIPEMHSFAPFLVQRRQQAVVVEKEATLGLAELFQRRNGS